MVSKIWVIFWKDLLTRRNHYVATILELLIPVGIITLANLAQPNFDVGIDNDPISFEPFQPDKCVQWNSHRKIVYEPGNAFTKLLMSHAACYAGYKITNVKPGKISDNSTSFSIGVQFNGIEESDDEIPNSLSYTLYPTNKVWKHMMTLWRHSGLRVPRYSNPILHEVVEFQRAIDVSYLHLKNIPATKINLENTDLFGRGPRIYSLTILTSLFLSFFLMVPPIVSRIIQEKFTGAKELMLMMGVAKWELWTAKFLDVLLFCSISVSGLVIFLYVPLKETSSTLKTAPMIFWAILLYGIIGVIVFLFFLSCFFEKVNVGVFVVQAVWCFSFLLSQFLFTLFDLPEIVKYLFCLFPHIPLMNSVSIFLDFDFYRKKVRLTERLTANDDTLCLLNMLLFILFDIVLYSVLTWYLEQVKPGKFGVPQPYNFCFKKSYWIPKRIDSSINVTSAGDKHPDNFESVPSHLKAGVSIQKVSKIFKTVDKGSVTAVDNVNIDFYHGEISALLGHNGAGKTTIFSIITGLTYPTSGQVLVNGYNLGVNTCEARRSLGLCPQQDMLFSSLTTLQTLKLYGMIKGLSPKEANKDALEIIRKLKLENVMNTQASNLSGGQKRKVSLGIALIGGSEVLVLDEPTSGMDPEIRREMWEILLGFRGSRTILLTTHFMEEADALCDRIAIMDHGKIKCYGSPMFLKSKHGKGYVLSVVALDIDKASEITGYIQQVVPLAKFKSQNIRTLIYEVPENEIDEFPRLLSGLDEKQKNNEIASYSINLSTLEDVFLRLRSKSQATEGSDITDSPSYKKLDIADEFDLPKSSGFMLYLNQFWALMMKKWILFLRSYKSFLMYSILPIALVVLMSYVSKNNVKSNTTVDLSKPLLFSTSHYSPFSVLYSNPGQNNISKSFEEFISSLKCYVEEVPNIKKAIYNIFQSDFHKYSREVNLAVNFTSQELTVLHNDNAVHMVPIALNVIHNFLLRLFNANSNITTSLNIQYADKEIFVAAWLAPTCNLDDLPDFSGAQTLYYLLSPMKEAFFGAKQIQLMITPASLYWGTSLLFDIVSFILYMLAVCVSVGLSQDETFMVNNAGEIFVSFILWGIGLILLGYIITTVTKSVAAACSINITVYVLFTFIIYNFISSGLLPEEMQYLHPSCIIKFGFVNLCAGRNRNYMLALFVYDVVLFGLLVLIDSKLLSETLHHLINRLVKVNYVLEDAKDEFVKEEESTVRKLINKDNYSGSVLIVDELKKWYLKKFKPSPAVRGISFTVSRGECFGLLGVNGAGKTSTFKMLTGELSTSYGRTYVCSTPLSFMNRQKYLFSIGYCPQFGGLIPVFKGRELLKFFGLLRGMKSSRINEEVRKWLQKLDLFEFANQKCGSYSGGNQRKLSTAVSLMGDYPIVFLDEPTSGVDPLSRRLIWKAISDIQNEGQSVVLTSHSMDECEALCSRLAIMVNGRFRCIGEITTLKDRFGKGYCIQIKIQNGTSEESLLSLKEAVSKSFEPGCEIVDEHLTIIQYHVTNKSISWADLFSKLKVLKEKFPILESYTASATTLEQIFIHFARNQ